ncbi:hypothetical protein, partial [Paraburkholderia hospita]|uniref:hypothetical protein n=1 Tax=Paraburkholderia hospita TaxID=169430 RepID=UPI001A99CDAC
MITNRAHLLETRLRAGQADVDAVVSDKRGGPNFPTAKQVGYRSPIGLLFDRPCVVPILQQERARHPSSIVDPKRGDFSRAGPRPPRCALCVMARGDWHAATDSQQGRLLQKFQRFQFVQSTRACFT